ncbi:hypothetical protein [Ekhidna sp.]|uniref:hypothetical protein n=1 Tax=Ekhidna sp. TaxID=2608089 RepID=UPI003519C32F
MKEKYIEDLKEIKDIMNRSSRFISLSGLSGITAGVIALTGVYLLHKFVFEYQDYLIFDRVAISSDRFDQLWQISLGTLLLAILSVIYLTTKETKKRNQRIWDHHTKRILVNLTIPLFTGGILCLTLLFEGFIGMLPPLSLIFYGLALINVSKYTLNEIRNLGLLEVALGLIAMQYIEHGLIFWSIGFGGLHILYGAIVYRKYKL